MLLQLVYNFVIVIKFINWNVNELYVKIKNNDECINMRQFYGLENIFIIIDLLWLFVDIRQLWIIVYYFVIRVVKYLLYTESSPNGKI